MDDLSLLVGERLREFRHLRGFSIGALAGAAGIGKGSLSEIENGGRNPTLSTLYALANALGTPLATLLAGQPGAQVSSPGIDARLLDVTTDDSGTVEVYRLHLDAGARHRSAGHTRGVVEHLLVLEGHARVGRLRSQVDLAAGESTSWRSDVTHSFAALGDLPVESVLVIRSPA